MAFAELEEIWADRPVVHKAVKGAVSHKPFIRTNDKEEWELGVLIIGIGSC